jgi:rfaE bifunctional protein kinase chain/domain
MRDAISRLRVLIVGDVMLDEYWFGDVHRISPEAPVPIVRVQRSDERPGGAANVARNVVALGAQATLLSVVGADTTAERLRRVLRDEGVNHALQVDESVKTTLKLRIIGHQQQMLRIDFEGAPSDGSLDAKQAEFAQLLPEADVVLFSDYGKGTLGRVSSMIAAAKEAGRLTIIDPKGRDYDRYTGADVITPNRGELADAMGPWTSESEMNQKAEALRERLGLQGLLLTMSEQGMRLFCSGSTLTRAASAKEVFDVSGAGDTVVAAVAVMRGIGASWEDTVNFANAAAGVVVSRLGASAATLDEVLAAAEQPLS